MQEVLVSKIFNYASTPTKNVEGQFWFNPSTNVLSRFNGTIWKPITVSSDDVAVLTDGSKVSLTSYLNTQIAALAEGIDSKQNKLLYYSETSGDIPSATVSVDNIKLNGKVAEGNNTKASGIYSHAEGGNTRASGNYSHAEGQNTSASGSYSHTEGSFTSASGSYSHVEGSNTKALSIYQHVQGKYNIEDANDKYADIIGNGSDEGARSNAATVSWDGISWSQTDVRAGGTDQDNATHSLSNKQDKLLYYSETPGFTPSVTISVANINFRGSVAEGDGATASGYCSHAEGDGTTASGYYSHTEGSFTTASGYYSHAEGLSATASGNYSHAEGRSTTTSGEYSHAEGLSTTASGRYSHAEGSYTIASSTGSHAEGNRTNASGYYSHAEGSFTTASAFGSHVEGYHTITSSDYQHAQGKYNIEDANDKYADIIGNGSDEGARSNAATVSWNGISWSQTDVRAGGTDQDSAAHSLSAKQNATDNTLTTTAKTISGAINELKTATDSMVVVSTDNAINVAPTTAQTGILIASSKTNGGNVIITPKITNTGACYLSTASTYSNLNPIYPDPTNNKYTYPNLGTVYLFVDNAGDSADIVIENFAG